MLISYEKYVELGGELSEPNFNIYEALSEAELNSIADGALPDVPLTESCMMIMINAYYSSDNMPLESRATSYNNDGVSVSLATQETPESILELARSRVKLLFSNAGIKKYLGVLHLE